MSGRELLGVYCGPSLPEADRLPMPGVHYLAPASRDDVARDAQRFENLLMIDGVFHHDVAPAPKEVYAALAVTRMFGASSMGALRAAECRPYGMIPLGIIARWYVREVIDGDDEVAVLVHPRTDVSLTVPLVNVRYVARLAARRHVLTSSEADAFVQRARMIFYMDRSWGGVVACSPDRVRAEIADIAERFGDLKRWDARFALRSVARRLNVLHATA